MWYLKLQRMTVWAPRLINCLFIYTATKSFGYGSYFQLFGMQNIGESSWVYKTNSSSHRCFVKALATAYINNLPSKYMYPVVSTRSYHLNVWDWVIMFCISQTILDVAYRNRDNLTRTDIIILIITNLEFLIGSYSQLIK